MSIRITISAENGEVLATGAAESIPHSTTNTVEPQPVFYQQHEETAPRGQTVILERVIPTK